MNIEEMRKAIKPYEKEKPYVFISYSKKDAELVYPVILQLQNRGVNLWIDKNLEGTGGQSWQANAFDAISEFECKKILFFMSRNSFLSMPCCAELLYTLNEDIKLVHNDNLPIVPISVENEINLGKIIKICEVQNDYNSKIDATVYQNIIQNSLNAELKNLMNKMGSQGKILKSTIINKVKEHVFNNDFEITVVNTDIDAILTNIPDECKNQNITNSVAKNLNSSSSEIYVKSNVEVSDAIKECQADDIESVRIKYWEKLNEVLGSRDECKFQVRNAKNKNYCDVKGQLFKGVGVQANITKKRIYAYIWINVNNDKNLNQKIFDVMVVQKENAEASLSNYKGKITFDWKRDKGSDNVSCGVNVIMDNADFTNESDWSRQHEFLADAMITLDNKLIRENEEKLKDLIKGASSN